MPTSTELYTIETPFVEKDPATLAAFRGASCGSDCGNVDDPACSCISDGLYWAAGKLAAAPEESWMTLFYCRGNLFLHLGSSKFHVRAVRGDS
jgi:hypothetical protein